MVFAEDTNHVSAVARLCNDNEIPLIPFGTGTGLEGGINAVQVCGLMLCIDELWQ